jgi:hypothetical protein
LSRNTVLSVIEACWGDVLRGKK